MIQSMEYPKATAFLERARTAQARVEKMKERIRCIELMMTDKSVHLTDIRVCGSGDPQKNEWLYAEKDELVRKKEEMAKERDRIFDEVRKMIFTIEEPTAQEILIHHYLRGLSWSQTARKVRYSMRQMIRYRELGYAEIEEKLTIDN